MSFITKCMRIYATKFPNCISANQGAIVVANQTRNYAARKGTREKARKRKVKVEEKKTEFIPHNLRGLDKIVREKKKFDDSWKAVAADDVYPMKYYQWRVYPFSEAVQCHQETHDPTMYNLPDAALHVLIELYMQGDKPTRFVDSFHRMAPMPHRFDHGEDRAVLAFAKDAESLDEALKAGAAVAGGVELIKEIQTGKLPLSDFQYVVAHPNILPELVCLRGLMKRKFPNPKNETLSIELGKSVDKFLNGINYSAVRDEYEKDFGSIDTVIGKLSMDAKQLEENFGSLVNDVYKMRPRRDGIFISRCLLFSPPTTEKLKVDHRPYVDEKSKQAQEDNEEEEKAEAVA